MQYLQYLLGPLFVIMCLLNTVDYVLVLFIFSTRSTGSTAGSTRFLKKIEKNQTRPGFKTRVDPGHSKHGGSNRLTRWSDRLNRPGQPGFENIAYYSIVCSICKTCDIAKVCTQILFIVLKWSKSIKRIPTYIELYKKKV